MKMKKISERMVKVKIMQVKVKVENDALFIVKVTKGKMVMSLQNITHWVM